MFFSKSKNTLDCQMVYINDFNYCIMYRYNLAFIFLIGSKKLNVFSFIRIDHYRMKTITDIYQYDNIRKSKAQENRQ